ncbi:MAG: hypothetical protein A2W11_04380 [Ignavibacteria bacterium RBG_16_35_7]|nr:MAG: hypothetical protein A2W11_04380 [Ignavibacteria bacterium RBG_16_35_7]
MSLLHLSCSDSPSSLGADLLSQDLINILELDSAKDSLFQSSSTYKKVIALSNADRLLLGKKDNVEAGILVKFLIFFADSIKQQIINNELTVLSAKVEFTKNYTFGNSSAPIDYSVHQINSSWSTGFTSDSLTLLSFDANDISFGKTFTDTINTFNFDNQTALNWLKARADSITPIDNGLYVKPSMSSEKIIGFQALSIDDLSIPSLEIVIQKAGVYIDTLSYFPSIDLSVISGSLPDVGFENIGIQAGLNSEARLFFNLSSLPKGIVVNYAKLILTIDTIKTITGSSFTNSLRVNYLTDSTSLIIDSTFSLFLDRDSNTFEGSVTSFVQRTLIENNNQGLLLSASDKLNGVELFAIKGSNAAIFTERPKLQIIYTSKK